MRIMRHTYKMQLTVLCLIVLGVLVHSVAVAQMYEARVTIADMRSHQYQGAGDQDEHLANLQKLATSPIVQERALKTLDLLQLPNPQLILSSMVVDPVPGTEMLSLRVTAKTKTEARAAGNVIALEFIRYYDEYLEEQGPTGKPHVTALKIISQGTVGTTSPILLFGRYPKTIAIPAIAGAGGLLFGLLMGILIGRRSARPREY
jgi:capsular polysaccharide biosynthesis protein